MEDFLRLPSSSQVEEFLATKALFNTLTKEELGALLDNMELLYINGGVNIIQQGDLEGDMYVLIHGRLRVYREDEITHEEVTISEIGPGQIVGEISLLISQKRTATVRAIRDCVVLKCPKSAYEKFLDQYPKAAMKIARLSIQRLTEPSLKAKKFTDNISNIALVPLNDCDLAKQLIHEIESSVRQSSHILMLDRHMVERKFDASIDSLMADTQTRDKLTRWLNEQEYEYDLIFYITDPTRSPWTRLCLRQSDCVYLLAEFADHSPVDQAMYDYVFVTLRDLNRTGLILLHPDATKQPSGTAFWLERYPTKDCYHIAVKDPEHIARICRIITGKCIGLVMSGGGARGLGHVGVIKAMQELGIKADLVGGTSSGALVAAAYAMGMSAEEMIIHCGEFAHKATKSDLTIPIMAVMAGRRLDNAMIDIFSDQLRMEDLWMTMYCISSNITQCKLNIHKNGLLWRAVRSSISLPGIFPPVIIDEGLLVDGVVLNNLPVDVMHHDFFSGKVLASSINISKDEHYYDTEINGMSGLDLVLRRLLPHKKTLRAPLISDVLMQSIAIHEIQNQKRLRESADWCVELELSHFEIMGFKAYMKIIDCAYEQALKVLSKITV